MAIFAPERRTIKKFERENIKIDENHIKKVLGWLTERDIKILDLLLYGEDKNGGELIVRGNRFLKTSQIQMLAFADLKPGSWQDKCNQRLRRLYHAHLIDRWYPPTEANGGSSESHYVLDKAGAMVLAHLKGYDAKEWKKEGRIPQHYQHILLVSDFRALLSVLDRQLGVVKYEDGEGTIGEVLNWKIDKEAKIKYRFREGNGAVKMRDLKPDALCFYKYDAKGHFVPFFLEADNGTEPLDELKSKIRNYIACRKSGDWKKTQWGNDLGRFPKVAFLFHDEKTANSLAKFAQGLDANVKFYFSTYNKLYDANYKEYINKSHGKRRYVLQEIRINILEKIWQCSYESGLVPITT